MTPDQLLDIYDSQLRTDGEVSNAVDVLRHGPLWWARFTRGSGFVTYRDLAGHQGPALDALIAETVAHFHDETDVAHFEWKTRGHDLPADLGKRLQAHGLVPEEIETVMLGEAAALAVEVPLPDGVDVRRVDDAADRDAAVTAAADLQREIFGAGPSAAEVLERIERLGATSEFWIAEAEGQVVSAGRLELVVGTEVAGLWGGATHPDWRGRGVYRALTAARAASAVRRGIRYLHSDCTAMSRPILERSGLVAVTTTTPYVWTR